MRKEKIIGMLASICLLLLACSEQEENESLYAGVDTEKVDVRLTLSSIPKVQWEGNTDYHPMSGRAEEKEEVNSLIANRYNCLVMKEIGEKWYVDTLVYPTLTQAGLWSEVKVTKDTKFNDLQLTLRPGHYRVLVVLNPRSTNWNRDLKPGAVVKGGADTVAHAYTYNFQTDGTYANLGKRQVRYEVFAGTAEFTVEKTTNVHSDPINGNTHITFSRKVMQMRFLLKDHKAGKEEYNFENTQHTVHATLKATEPDKHFCDGLDCWGDAYYNHQTPTRELPICTDIDPDWRLATTGERYKMISGHVTIYSPFIFADKNVEPLYELDTIKVVGQSGQGGFVYVYPNTITGLKLVNNTIQPIVFQTTEEVDGEIVAPQLQVTLEHLPDEAFKDLFSPYYECNIP